MKIKFFIFLFLLNLNACSNPTSPNEKKITVEKKSYSTTLLYSGTIRPIKTTVVPSPVDGLILEMPFHYGEAIKSGEKLFTISSKKFLSDYKAALLQYVKIKNEFNNAETKFSEARFLHKHKLISDDDYKMNQSNFYSAQLALLQAKDSLANLLQQLEIKNPKLYDLSISDIEKITKALHLKMNSENLSIFSPVSGLFLSALKNGEENKKRMKGDAIKQGDVLAIIGDMTGIDIPIKVNELVVNQLKVGQKVNVSGDAFSGHNLNGEIKSLDKQGESVSGALPDFIVEVIVPHLTQAEQQIIHAGMSAKIKIVIEESPQIIVPMAAVKERDGVSYVNLYDKKLKKTHEIAVKTGSTTPDSVAILSNLKPGDQILISG